MHIARKPNVLASAMKGKSTYQIALLIPDMDNPIEREAWYFTLLQKNRVDGVIILSGFEDQHTITDPPLTTVAQPMEQMGKQIVDILIQEIKGELKHKQSIVLLPELVVRKSTGER